MKRIASLLLISAAAAALLALDTKKCNGDWLLESADGSEKDIDVHVTVPSGTNCTVTGYKDGSPVTNPSQVLTGSGSNIDGSFSGVDQIKIVFNTAGKLDCQWASSGASSETQSTWDATNQDVVLWRRTGGLTWVNFHLDVDDPGDSATVQAFDGTTVIHEWTVDHDHPLDFSVETSGLKVLSGGDSGSFSYSTGG